MAQKSVLRITIYLFEHIVTILMPKLVPGYKDEVKEKILETAWDVISRKGTKETTMDDFASAMKCSKGALYNYFKNKDELLQEAISTRHIRIQEELFARFSEGDFFENAEKYFDNEIQKSLGRMQATLDLLAEGTRNTKLCDALTSKYNGAIDSFVNLLEYLQKKNMIVLKTEIEEAARLIYALRTGIYVGTVTGLTRENAKRIWLDGLKGIISTP